MSTVIWLCGGHRSGSNFVGCFLTQCGAETQAKVTPQPSTWNAEYSDDPWILFWLDTCLGQYSGNSLAGASLPNPSSTSDAIHAAVDPSDGSPALAKFIAYLQGRFGAVSAGAPYLLKANVGAAIYSELLSAFPDGTTHVLVSTRRNPDSQAASLASVSGASTDDCVAYLGAIETQLQAMEADFTQRGWEVLKVNFDDIIADQHKILQPVVDALGLTATDAAWGVFNADEVRF